MNPARAQEGEACAIILEDGGICPGRMEFGPPIDCSCHISPPCDSCVSRELECSECGQEMEAVG